MEHLRALDTAEMRREALDEWELAIAQIEQGERFEGRALFAPFFWEERDDRRRRRTKEKQMRRWRIRPPSFVLRQLA